MATYIELTEALARGKLSSVYNLDKQDALECLGTSEQVSHRRFWHLKLIQRLNFFKSSFALHYYMVRTNRSTTNLQRFM